MNVHGPVNYPVIIIGAGAAGLSIAYALKERGIENIVLDKAHTAADSWLHMPEYLSLISMWTSNYLIKNDKHLYPQSYQSLAENYANYLMEFGRKFELNIQTDCEVRSLRKADDCFLLETSVGEMRCHYVVNCTGYYNNPFTPEYKGLKETEIPHLHFKDYKNISQIRKLTGYGRKKILIVGKRLSAGQLIMELEKENFKLAVSARSRITKSSMPFFNYFFIRFLELFELLILLLMKPKSADVKMDYKAWQLIRKRRVRRFPDIKEFKQKSVLFEDNTEKEFDLVLFTTGFKPVLGHLPEKVIPKGKFESEGIPGLYFLGFDGIRNFRSRFIRGIRVDVVFLANEIRDKLSPENK